MTRGGSSEWIVSTCFSCTAEVRYMRDSLMDAAPSSLADTSRSSGLAITSLLLGLCSVFLGILTGIPAILLGIIALRQINRSGGRLRGEGVALAGICSGVIISLLMRPALIVAIQAAREAALRNTAICNMKQFTLALQNYHDVNKHFPVAPAGNGKNSGLSWRVYTLPFLDESALYSEFHLDEPWDSDHNRTLIAKMPQVFQDPACNSPDGKTSYLAVIGPGTAFGDASRESTLQNLKNGSSHTPLLVEADADQAVIWTKPDDWRFDPNDPKRGLGGLRKDGFILGFADAHTEFVDNSTEPETIRAIMTGKNPLDQRAQ
jgi:hypothetical protein